MKIIDFRFRPNTREILEGFARVFKANIEADGFTLEDYVNNLSEPIETIVANLKKNDYAKAVIVGRDIETTFGVPSNNDEVKGFCNAYPEVFAGFVGVDPHKGEAAVAELTHRVKNEGFVGAATDPIQALIPADDKLFYPFYAECCKLNIPIIITGGPGRFVERAVAETAAPRYIDNVARDCPNLKIVVSHGAWPYVNEMINVAFRNRNVYFEMSEYELFPMSNLYMDAINTIIKDKVVFASAHPAVNYLNAVELYQKLPLEDDAREMVMWKNAEQILER